MKSLSLCRFTFTLNISRPKKLLFLLFTLCTTAVYAQQNGAIKGTIKTSDGKPAESVTIKITELDRGTTVDDQGHYKFNHVKAGHYTLTATHVGFAPQSLQADVKDGETTVLDFTLAESSQSLHEVVVNSNKPNKFANEKTDYVAKMPLKDIENPQVYNTVTQALMQEQMVTDLNGALKNVPGVTMLLQGDGSGGDFASRGFASDAYMRNGMVAYMNSQVDPANIERIEAIKGPSATLFGGSFTSFGGLFNRITKKPLDTTKGEVGYTIGGFGLSRLTADLNAPINADRTALFRLNIADQHEGSFMDAGFSNHLFIAPSLSYKINDRLSILVDAEIYKETMTTPFRFFPEASFTVTTPQQLNFDYRRSFTSNDLTASNPTTNIFTQVDYKISDQWKSQTNVTYTNTQNNGIFSWNSVQPGDSTVARYQDPGTITDNIFDVQENINGDFKTGPLRHRLVVGLDMTGYKSNSYYGFVAFDQVKINGYDPEYSALNNNSLNAKLAGVTYSHDINTQYDYAAYASDAINLTDKLIAMLSLRVDRFENKGDQDIVDDTLTGKFGQTALSPKFGLVYELVKDKVSLFGNYMNSFQNQNGTDHNHNPFKPEQANQWEGGVKLDLFNGLLSSTISYYDIKVTDVLRTDPNFPNFNIQDGTQYSKGIEASVTGNPFPGFNVIAGYAYNDSKYENIDPTLNGYRPGSAGPANTANLWLSYALTHGTAKGLGIGFGGNYASKNNIIDETDGIFTLPSYVVLNASAFYDQPKYRIGFKIDNLTDKQYWVGWSTIIPQMPARFSASLTLKF